MKTRYKIILVIGLFALFYVQVPWMYKQCSSYDTDCTLFVNLMNWTRMGIFSDGGIWNTGDGTEQEPIITDYLRINQNFILTMLVTPSVIITAIVLWDKRR